MRVLAFQRVVLLTDVLLLGEHNSFPVDRRATVFYCHFCHCSSPAAGQNLDAFKTYYLAMAILDRQLQQLT